MHWKTKVNKKNVLQPLFLYRICGLEVVFTRPEDKSAWIVLREAKLLVLLIIMMVADIRGLDKTLYWMIS